MTSGSHHRLPQTSIALTACCCCCYQPFFQVSSWLLLQWLQRNKTSSLGCVCTVCSISFVPQSLIRV